MFLGLKKKQGDVNIYNNCKFIKLTISRKILLSYQLFIVIVIYSYCLTKNSPRHEPHNAHNDHDATVNHSAAVIFKSFVKTMQLDNKYIALFHIYI